MSRRWLKIGDVFGNLKIVGLADRPKCGIKAFLCQCTCGRIETKTTANIKRSQQIGSGCSQCGLNLKRQKKTIHGESNSPLHKAWMRMRSRCNTATSTQYKWYGGKGIRLCNEWNDYKTFSDWAKANGYEPGLVIDRIDPNKNYEPSNCRCITISENCREARRSQMQRNSLNG